MQHRTSSKGGENSRSELPKSPNVYGAPEPPQGQTTPLLISRTGSPMASPATIQMGAATLSARHMNAPNVGARP
ncbi:hypothetical protein FRC11_006948, partial [Ceratobasidium sp. 423]